MKKGKKEGGRFYQAVHRAYAIFGQERAKHVFGWVLIVLFFLVAAALLIWLWVI